MTALPLTEILMLLAALVAADWDAQAEEIDTLRMPAQRLAATAIDRVAGVRVEVAEEIARYAGSDLLCYRAESPASLVEAVALGERLSLMAPNAIAGGKELLNDATA